MSQHRTDSTTEDLTAANFTKKNYIIMVVGVALMVLGYFLMMGGAADDISVFNAEEKYSFVRITLSPILILAGLIIQIPAIMMRFKD